MVLHVGVSVSLGMSKVPHVISVYPHVELHNATPFTPLWISFCCCREVPKDLLIFQHQRTASCLHLLVSSFQLSHLSFNNQLITPLRRRIFIFKTLMTLTFCVWRRRSICSVKWALNQNLFGCYETLACKMNQASLNSMPRGTVYKFRRVVYRHNWTPRDWVVTPWCSYSRETWRVGLSPDTAMFTSLKQQKA